MKYYLSDNFHVAELVHPKIIAKIGERRAAGIVDPRAVTTLEAIRALIVEHWGWNQAAITVNVPGVYESSGVRLPGYGGVNNLSSHKWGNTYDLKFKVPVADVFFLIMAKPERFPYLIRIENPEHTRSKYGKKGRDWFHIETGPERQPDEQIYVFNP